MHCVECVALATALFQSAPALPEWPRERCHLRRAQFRTRTAPEHSRMCAAPPTARQSLARAHLSRLSRCARACRDGCGLCADHTYALRRPSPQAVASVAGMLSRTSEALLELQHKAPAPPPCRARAAASAVASAATSAAASAATSAIASARGRRRQRRCQCRRRRLQRHPSAVQPLGSLSSSPSGAGSGAGSGRRRHARVRCAPLPPSSASSLAAGSPAPCALLPTPPPPASCLLPPASSDRQRARAIWQARPPAPTRRPRAGARAIARTSRCGSSPCSDVGAPQLWQARPRRSSTTRTLLIGLPSHFLWTIVPSRPHTLSLLHPISDHPPHAQPPVEHLTERPCRCARPLLTLLTSPQLLSSDLTSPRFIGRPVATAACPLALLVTLAPPALDALSLRRSIHVSLQGPPRLSDPLSLTRPNPRSMPMCRERALRVFSAVSAVLPTDRTRGKPLPPRLFTSSGPAPLPTDRTRAACAFPGWGGRPVARAWASCDASCVPWDGCLGGRLALGRPVARASCDASWAPWDGSGHVTVVV